MIRGHVVRVRAPRRPRGREQQGERLGVVVQADRLLDLSTVLVAPTSTRAQPAAFRPDVSVGGERTLVLVDHLASLAVERLGDPVAVLTHEELRDVERALRLMLSL